MTATSPPRLWSVTFGQRAAAARDALSEPVSDVDPCHLTDDDAGLRHCFDDVESVGSLESSVWLA